jgi:hypothetical protein
MMSNSNQCYKQTGSCAIALCCAREQKKCASQYEAFRGVIRSRVCDLTLEQKFSDKERCWNKNSGVSTYVSRQIQTNPDISRLDIVDIHEYPRLGYPDIQTYPHISRHIQTHFCSPSGGASACLSQKNQNGPERQRKSQIPPLHSESASLIRGLQR